MKYRYETHLHTNVGSLCGTSSPEDYIKTYIDLGFTGIIVTDHFFNGNCAVDKSLPWKEQVDRYAAAYERALEEGQKQGLDVFFGFESRIGNAEFLVYGVDKLWLYDHPEIVQATALEQYRLVSEGGGAVVQAHPCRERDYQDGIEVYPYCVDAIEGYNLCDSLYEDRRSRDYAGKYGLCSTAGSDVHNIAMFTGEKKPFGVISDTKWNSIADYVAILKSGCQMELEIGSMSTQKPEFTLNFPVDVREDR